MEPGVSLRSPDNWPSNLRSKTLHSKQSTVAGTSMRMPVFSKVIWSYFQAFERNTENLYTSLKAPRALLFVTFHAAGVFLRDCSTVHNLMTKAFAASATSPGSVFYDGKLWLTSPEDSLCHWTLRTSTNRFYCTERWIFISRFILVPKGCSL